jgi:NADH-quinone oxidoreductase subunit A
MRTKFKRGKRGSRFTMLSTYLPIVVLFALAFGFAVFSVIIATITGPKRYNKAKMDFYECGIEPAPMSSGPNRFPVKYFLTAMLFIVFDIEIIFLYPYAVESENLRLFGLAEIFLFIGTVFIAYAYVWRRGGLDWD